MPVFFDHDPLTGVTQTYDYDPLTDTHAITSHQDVSSVLDRIQHIRNNPDYWKKGVKKELVHYAVIPTVVELELLKKGIKLGDPATEKQLFKEINTNYTYLKTTDKVIR
jgi:hypothetical protein